MAGKKIENNTAGSPLEAHVASSKIRAEHIDKVYKTGKRALRQSRMYQSIFRIMILSVS